MGPRRNFINWISNQRADLGDIRAQQRNRASDLRRTVENLLFGANTDTQQRTFGGFNVTAQSPVTSLVDISAGAAFGGERLEDESIELGVIFGTDTALEKSLNFGVLAVATYTIWLRFSHDPGEAGSRVLFDPATETEIGITHDVELVNDWDVVISVASPGDEWQPLATVAWNGATIAAGDITQAQDTFFEGDAATGYPHEWGDGVNDRNVDRQRRGVKYFYQFVHAVRRQIEEIFDDGLTLKWYEVPPSNLKEVRDHIDDSFDPHGSPLSQTAISVTSLYRPIAVAKFWRVAVSAMEGSSVFSAQHEDSAINLPATGSGGIFRAPVHLPDGAVVSQLRMLGVVFGSSQSAHVSMWRGLRTGTVGTHMAGEANNSYQVQPVGSFVMEDLTISDPIIDNDTYSYWVVCEAFGSPPGSITLKMIEIVYFVTDYD